MIKYIKTILKARVVFTDNYNYVKNDKTFYGSLRQSYKIILSWKPKIVAVSLALKLIK